MTYTYKGMEIFGEKKNETDKEKLESAISLITWYSQGNVGAEAAKKWLAENTEKRDN